MARMAKMDTCPTCGAALATNLVKLLKTDPENYICPNGGAEKRKDWEKSWGEDLSPETKAVNAVAKIGAI